MPFKGVIFDMGDILYDASAWRRWLVEALQQHGVDITYPELVELWEAQLVDVYRGLADYWDRFDALLHTVRVPAGSRNALRRAAQRKGREVQQDRKPMDGVPGTLTALEEAGVKLAVLSDNESGSAAVRRLLAQLGIASHFDAVLSSVDVGQVKPHPSVYRAAVDALGLTIDACAFVGHDVDELEGARQVGLYAIAYNGHTDAPADVRLTHFRELETVVLGA